MEIHVVLIRTRCAFFLLLVITTIGIWQCIRDRRAGREPGRLSWVLPLPQDPALVAAHLAPSLPPVTTTKHSFAMLLWIYTLFNSLRLCTYQRHRATGDLSPKPCTKARAPTPNYPRQLPFQKAKPLWEHRAPDSSLHLPAAQLPHLWVSLTLCCTSAFYLPIIQLVFLWQGFPTALYS